MQRCHEVEVGDVRCHESCTLRGDDTVEKNLVTSISAVGAATLLGMLILSPPNVNCIQLGSAFYGLTVHMNCLYVMSFIQSAGTLCWKINSIVLVGFFM